MMGDAAKAIEGFRAVAAAPASERGRTVTNDELHFEYATALFRTGDFRGGKAELKLVNPTGPYERQLAPRLGLTGYTVQVTRLEGGSVRKRGSASANCGLFLLPEIQNFTVNPSHSSRITLNPKIAIEVSG